MTADASTLTSSFQRRSPATSTSGRDNALAGCPRLPAAELTHPFSESTAVFKVSGKIFAAVSLNDRPGRITLKCDPDHGVALIDKYNEVTPGYHMNKRHWITVTLDSGLPPTLIEDLTTDSYDLVLAALPARERPSPPLPRLPNP